jgi:hypothetical protein
MAYERLRSPASGAGREGRHKWQITSPGIRAIRSWNPAGPRQEEHNNEPMGREFRRGFQSAERYVHKQRPGAHVLVVRGQSACVRFGKQQLAPCGALLTSY